MTASKLQQLSVTVTQRAAAYKGFTLLEVLIALLILSIGLLGIAGLMSASLKSNDGSYFGTQASELAYDILDRMRVNRLAAEGGAYDGTVSGALTTVPFTQCFGSSKACDSAMLAQWDLTDWSNQLVADIPLYQATISTSQSGGVATATITIQWLDKRAQSALGATNPQPYGIQVIGGI